jgi:hypothetical protein
VSGFRGDGGFRCQVSEKDNRAATLVDLVIDSESFKLISLAILPIQTYSLPGGSQHEHI